jgi:hypothetical protein
MREREDQQVTSFFSTLAFTTPRQEVIPENHLQTLLGHVTNHNLKSLEGFDLQSLKECVLVLPQKEQDLVWCTLRGEKQKELARRLGIHQSAVSIRISRAVERILFYSRMPKVTEEDYRELGKHLRESVRDTVWRVDLVKLMIKTTSQTETAEMLNRRYRGRNFNQVKVRNRWKKTLSSIGGVPRLSKLKEAMDLVDRNLYILHEVRFPVGWKDSMRKGMRCNHKTGESA